METDSQPTKEEGGGAPDSGSGSEKSSMKKMDMTDGEKLPLIGDKSRSKSTEQLITEDENKKPRKQVNKGFEQVNFIPKL